MRIKVMLIRADDVSRLEVDENDNAAVYTKDGQKIRCKRWRFVGVGNCAFLALEGVYGVEKPEV